MPDWLTVADRQVRVADEAPGAAPGGRGSGRGGGAGRGCCQHLHDDARFHETRAFAELSLGLCVAARDVLAGEAGFRPSFLGHLLVELLLDAALIAENPRRLEHYYRLLDSVDAAWVQDAVNRIAPRPTERLAWFISAFRRERILWDYLEDARLMVRLNQVMHRVRLAPLPARFQEVLPEARQLVAARKTELLDGIPSHGEAGCRLRGKRRATNDQ